MISIGNKYIYICVYGINIYIYQQYMSYIYPYGSHYKRIYQQSQNHKIESRSYGFKPLKTVLVSFEVHDPVEASVLSILLFRSYSPSSANCSLFSVIPLPSKLPYSVNVFLFHGFSPVFKE